MNRDQIQLGEPEDPAVLAAEFPRLGSLGTAPWYRAHSANYPDQPDRGCWWFSSVSPPQSAEGRFDLPHPKGTCYFADDVEAAVRERLGSAWGRHHFLPPISLTDTTVSMIDPTSYVRARDIAHTDHRDAAGFVTREIGGGAPYELTCRHAAAFSRAGFEGIAYRPRFTPGDVLALALFGNAGRPVPRRLASDVPGWQAHLRSPIMSTISRRRAKIFEPPEV